MADYDYLPASNGSGDAALMHITAARSIGATTIIVDSVSNVPAKFIGTYGTLLANGYIDPATKRDFKGHTSGGNLIIDAFEPGNADAGNLASGQVVIIKPNTGWSNRIATFIKNATGFGTPEAVTFAGIAATSITTTSDATIGGNQTVAGNNTVTGNNSIAGTSRLVPVTIASAATITPTKQVYDVTALAVGATIAVPSYSPLDGMTGELRIKDNGGSQTLSFNSGWKAIGVTLPTATVAGKYLYITYRYSSADSKFHVLGIARE